MEAAGSPVPGGVRGRSVQNRAPLEGGGLTQDALEGLREGGGIGDRAALHRAAHRMGPLDDVLGVLRERREIARVPGRRLVSPACRSGQR